MVTHMNQKWRIVISICLVIAVCLPIVSAAIPTTKHNSPRFSVNQVNSIKTIPNSYETTNTIQDLFDKRAINSLGGIQKPNLTSNSLASTLPEISRPSIIFSRMTNADSSIYIPKEEAIETASALFPGICLIDTISADFKRINAPAYPLAKNPCWVVMIVGYNPKGDTCCLGSDCIEGNVIKAYFPYGGYIIIDAITGEILYVDYLN